MNAGNAGARRGDRDRFIQIQSPTLAAGIDPTAVSYTTVHSVWAKRMDRAQVERFVTAAELAQVEQAYQFDYVSGLDPNYRIKDGSELWDITGFANGRGRNRELIVTVTRHVPGDTT